jgi:hypothetical protein
MKNIRAGLLTMTLLLTPFAANAGQAIGPVLYLTQRASDGLIYVVINGANVGSPGCATSSYFMISNENSEVGKKQFAMLLTAKATGLRVAITGKNACTRWGDGEDIDEVKIMD